VDLDSIDSYDYQLPAELIAQYPTERRDASRLMVLSRQSGAIAHQRFSDLPDLLKAGDLLVANETRVVPARLTGLRTATGGKWEGLFLREEGFGRWRIIGQTRGRLQAGEQITLLAGDSSGSSETLTLTLLEKQDQGEWLVSVGSDASTWDLLDRYGAIPLPHYMHREAGSVDADRYQTTYARSPGAVAAPTAGLHFTPEVLDRCKERGIGFATVTLHVGLGTFRPVSVSRLSDHVMHHEWCQVPEETVSAILRTRESGGRVVAVGTTTVRTLESVAASGPLRAWSGATNLFLKPGSPFRVVDALITNFHLPRSTLLVLVSAFANREQVLHAYGQAIVERYRFYSYGDAMLID
jgi:S-adenosylmethionine:tRNA ribosyltransferase-isomerase